MTTPATGGERAEHDAWIAPFADEINEPHPDGRWARVVDSMHHRLGRGRGRTSATPAVWAWRTRAHDEAPRAVRREEER